MASLFDTQVRSSIEQRVRSLRSDAKPRWGRMSVDQMLWHVNQSMLVSLGEYALGTDRPPLPAGLIKFVVLNLPWMKNAPTNSRLVAGGTRDFEAERTRCLELVDTLTARPIAGAWPTHPVFGAMTGADVGRLHAKHLDHHLKQFSM